MAGLAYCEGPIYAKAKISVNFCKFSNCIEESETLRNNRIFVDNEQIKNRNDNQETEIADIGKETDTDPNRIIIIGIVFIITLITMSLVIGLIYFWCPQICTCCTRDSSKDDLGATKILTVRDNFGNIIPEAKTVEIWKTRENKVKAYDVPESETRKTKKGYKKLPEEQEDYSNFNSREESHRGFQVVDARSKPGGIVLLKKQRSPRNASRLTILEELDPRLLSPYPSSRRNESRIFRVLNKEDNHRDRIKVISLEDYQNNISVPAEVLRLGGHDDNNTQTLNFSRHYANNKPEQVIIEVERERRSLPAHLESGVSDKHRSHHHRSHNISQQRKDSHNSHHHKSDSYRSHKSDTRQNDNRNLSRKPNDVQVLRVHDDDDDQRGHRHDQYDDHTPRHVQNKQEVHHTKMMRDEASQSNFFQDTTIRDINSLQYYEGSDQTSALNPKRSEIKRAMSAISAIIEGDPSDYEEEEEPQIKEVINEDILIEPTTVINQSTEDLQHLGKSSITITFSPLSGKF